MIPFAETIDRAKKYVVSGTLDRVDWNAELLRGDLGEAVRRLKEQPGEGLHGRWSHDHNAEIHTDLQVNRQSAG